MPAPATYPSCSLLDAGRIQKCLDEWYGAKMRITSIMTPDEEIADFESKHCEFPPWIWEFVSHTSRQIFLWARNEIHGDTMEIVVKRDNEFRLVQDLVFRDEYPTEKAWWASIRDVFTDKEEVVYFVFHE